LIVSNAGFPWRMASTGALFALSLALLAASDAQLDLRGRLLCSFWVCKAVCVRAALGIGAVCMMLTLYISQRAAESEKNLVRGIKIALTISGSRNPRDPYWNADKEDMLVLMRKGIALNRHYRKLTPIVADQLASWGDWGNAIWIWESVLDSRPNIVAIIANIARAHLEMGNIAQAQAYLARARRLQPTSAAVQTLETMIMTRGKKTDVQTGSP
jgi:O-antigen ligase